MYAVLSMTEGLGFRDVLFLPGCGTHCVVHHSLKGVSLPHFIVMLQLVHASVLGDDWPSQTSRTCGLSQAAGAWQLKRQMSASNEASVKGAQDAHLHVTFIPITNCLPYIVSEKYAMET